MAESEGKNRTTTVQRVAVALLAVVVACAAALVSDRIYGRFLMPDTADLVFPAFSRAHHRSVEFDLTVRINNLGFRGADVAIAKQRPRVLLIGDSFTFGWGVDGTETWAHLLQAHFPEMEVLNLGQGGTHPGEHLRLARKAIPLLRPDVVLVSVLQGNDLHQLMRVIAYERGEYTPSFPRSVQPDGPSWPMRLRSRLLPNLSRRFAPQVEIRDRWLAESEAMLAAFNEEQSAAYACLDEDVRRMFTAGLLNPSLIFEAMHFPDSPCAAADTSGPLLRDAITRLSHCLKGIDSICSENGSRMVALSLPNRPYGCPGCADDLTRLGYAAEGCDTLDGDLPFVMAAEAAGVDLITVSDGMMTAPEMFFPLDGHWNRLGNLTFAEILAERLKQNDTWNSSPTSGNF